MILGADSSGFHPTLAQLQAAYAAGVRVWGFYLPGPYIYSGNTQADFDHAHQAGMKSIGWASGNADPGQQRALAASWSVDYPTLDCEGGIRGLGPWTQQWLDTSGFGIYLPYGADGSIFNGVRAPWVIMADYLGAYPYNDPQATWRGPAPAVPHGWQWAGTVNAFGGSVDRLWLDDWFGTPQGEDLTPEQDATLTRVDAALQFIINDPKLGLPPIAAVQQFAINDPNVGLVAIKAELAELARQLAATVGSVGPKGDTGPAGPAATSVTINGTFPAS